MNPISPLKFAYARRFPGEVAIHLSRYGSEETVQTLEGLPDDVAAAVISRLPHGSAIRALAGQSDERIAAWLGAAALDHALAIVLHVDAGRRAGILDALPGRRTRRTLQRLVVFPTDTVGANLNPAARRLASDMRLGEAVELLRRDEPESEQAIWLVDGEGNYVGQLDAGRALAARSDRSRLGEFLVAIRPLRAETKLTTARDYAEWLEHPELPVIDGLGHLLGSISRARLMAKLGSTNASEAGLADGIGELARQYFRIMGICLGDLFDTRRTRR